MADDVSLTLLKSLIPGLHRDAQAGDAGARRELVRVLGMVAEREGKGFDTAQTPTQPAGGQAAEEVSRLSQGALNARIGELAATGGAMPPWLELYDALLEERKEDGARRWDWRKALLIAWAATPKSQREPRTLAGLAERLGVRVSTMRKWRVHDPEIERRISELPRRLLLEHVADVFDALVEVARQPDPRAYQDRRLFLEITGNYQPSGALTVTTPIAIIEVAEDE